MNTYKHFFKPLADRFVALALLCALSPLILVIAFLLFIFNKGSIFFFQQRPGYKGKPFSIIKFKTMCDTYDSKGHPLPDSERLTIVGKLIRSSSLDEIPQLFNVVKGDMSFVGPRPLLMKYLPRYSPRHFTRHDVMPGITGWAQINGRNTISWEQKFEYDLKYVERQSFLLDLHILWLTVMYVLRRTGINAENHATIGEYKGIQEVNGVE